MPLSRRFEAASSLPPPALTGAAISGGFHGYALLKSRWIRRIDTRGFPISICNIGRDEE